ncbi:substrate-binding periplasmic protein [Bdellovibrio sp. BCCA]|uniref:substrate-binding periplasmic protein n=1 Tax=Bdellovibrio sp. BCCA TaxID=3136281 RepID=UPI0030F2351A
MSTESPPFLSESMKDQGAGIFALRKLLKKAGYDLEVRFAPWERAKVIARSDASVGGIFPYAAKDLADFLYSKPIYRAKWVIVERKQNPITWDKIEDLSKFTMGNVTGVELRPGIKELAETNKLKVENASTDLNNLLKLANKRIDFITMDATVFKYQMWVEPKLQSFREALQINPKFITVTEYGLALKKSPDHEALLKVFNKVSSFEEANRHIDFYLEHLQDSSSKKK